MLHPRVQMSARALYPTADNSTACKNWGERQWFWQQLGLTEALLNARVLPQSDSRTQGRSRMHQELLLRNSGAGADGEAGVVSEGL